MKHHINIETMIIRELGGVAAVCGVPPSLDSLTFREFIRKAAEMGVTPTSLLLKLAPRHDPSAQQG